MKKFLSLIDEQTKRLIMFLGIGIGVFIFIIVLISIVKGISGNKVNDDKLLEIMTNSAEKYFKDKALLPTGEGSSASVSTDTLVSEKYMKELSKRTKNTGCSGSVKVMHNGDDYLYVPSLKCNEYTTTNLYNEVTKTIVTEGNGLYKVDNEYVFKGEFVNNYVLFDNVLWRILSINQNGNIKILKNKKEPIRKSWDDRYNNEINQNAGINDYKLSRIRESLLEFYQNDEVITPVQRKYIVKSNWCIDKRKNADDTLTYTCDDTVNEYLGLIMPIEYVKGSFDKNCLKLTSKSCSNYNYMAEIFNTAWTITSSSDNSYEIYTIRDSEIKLDRALKNNDIVLLSNISGDNLYKKGDGTESNPYILK